MNVFGFQKYSLSLSKLWPRHEDGQQDLLSPGQPLGCGHFRQIIRCCLYGRIVLEYGRFNFRNSFLVDSERRTITIAFCLASSFRSVRLLRLLIMYDTWGEEISKNRVDVNMKRVKRVTYNVQVQCSCGVGSDMTGGLATRIDENDIDCELAICRAVT
jgi:hypothetical protein